VRLKTPEQARTIRGLVPTAATPELAGFLLIILGAGPEPEEVRPLLRNHLASDPAPPVRAAAAVALCRSGPRRQSVGYGGVRIPVAPPDATVLPMLSSALDTESSPDVKAVLADLLGLVAHENESVALVLVRTIAADPGSIAAGASLKALERCRQPAVAAELAQWLETGSVPESRIAPAIGLLQRVDPEKGAEIAAGLMGSALEPATRLALLGALAGHVSHPRTLEVVGEVLRSDPDAGLRRQAVDIVSGATDDKARDLLLAATGDADEEVRRAAEEALRERRERRRPAEGTVPDDR
jgi:hypothetical protein